jgi:hypothetical protein
MNFFEKLFPSQGLICVANVGPKGIRHRFFETLDDAISNAIALDAQGHTVYLAQATYSTEKIDAAMAYNNALPADAPKNQRKKRRSQENVHAIKAFWLDIDCGPEKPYANQAAGCNAISEMVRATGLPFPCVVRSGNGLYAYWFMEEDLSEAQWKGTAQLLKSTLTAYEFEADPARTSDSASILRPPGSTNRKNGTDKPVSIIKDADPISFVTFTHLLGTAAKARKIETTVLKPPKKQTEYDEFLSGITDRPPSSALEIAERCNQMRIIRDTKGNVPEPFWYAALCLLHYTEEYPQIQHLWSSGHPEYSYEATELKDQQIQTAPTTCHMFGTVNPQGCIGCSHSKKLHSPIALGYGKMMSEEGKWTPKGFKRTKDGIFYEDDDGSTMIYPWDLWVERVAYDDSLGYEAITIRHMMPHEGEKDVVIRSSLPKDTKAFMIELHDHHVQVIGKREQVLMGAYVENYVMRLRAQQKMSKLFCQMGWRNEDEDRVDDLQFILGEHIYGPGEEVHGAGLAKNIPELVKGFKCIGDKESWVQATEFLNQDEMIVHAFSLLAGGFGAPLMKFTGYAGAVLSIVGKSGIGKTLMGTFILSLYGRPEKLSCRKDDTPNALISRLGIFGSLPMYIDETSNIEPLALSDFVYKVTQGRDKARLTQKAVEKSNINAWNTVITTSSNHSLVERLGQAKADASAEINRVFEIFPEEMDAAIAKQMYRAVMLNCGHAGVEYIQYLVAHVEEHQSKLDQIMDLLEQKLGNASEERFWAALGAVAIYGGLIAKKLGLIRFEIAPIMDWFVDAVHDMRGSKCEQVVAPIDALAAFVEHYAGNILVCDKRKDPSGRPYVFVYREIKGAIIGRLETDSKRLFISRDVLRDHFRKSYISMKQFTEVLSNIKPRPVLLKANARKALGGGVEYLPTIAQPCLEFDLTVPELGHVAMSLIYNAEKKEDGEERKIV